MGSFDSLTAWALLRAQAPTIHPSILINGLGDIEYLLEASFVELGALVGVSNRLAKKLCASSARISAREEVERALSIGESLIPFGSEAYPERLAEIPSPPALVNLRGQSASLMGPAVAIVGSRDATYYGVDMARALGRDLALMGFVIVSGGARGVDRAAHEGALAAGGCTVAVRGSGLDIDYPRGHASLFKQLSETGANISEYGVGVSPKRSHFPRRNRIISGLSLGVVVVEAGRRSGALVTARIALEHNREVFAVPGALDNPLAMGTNQLIQQGAKLVMNADDIAVEICAQLCPKAPGGALSKSTLSEAARQIVSELQAGPRHVDELNLPSLAHPGRLSGVLLDLELKGWVSACPGGRYRLGSQVGSL